MKAVYPVSNLAYYSQKLLRAPGLLYNSFEQLREGGAKPLQLTFNVLLAA